VLAISHDALGHLVYERTPTEIPPTGSRRTNRWPRWTEIWRGRRSEIETYGGLAPRPMENSPRRASVVTPETLMNMPSGNSTARVDVLGPPTFNGPPRSASGNLLDGHVRGEEEFLARRAGLLCEAETRRRIRPDASRS